MEFNRIQFTPDLFFRRTSRGPRSTTSERAVSNFEEAPSSLNLVLGDEINRAPPKTQAALLEAMQEGQVTVEDVTYPLTEPFVVIATENPIEYEGTYPLPEAQLDRFLLRAGIGYPERDQEWEILRRRVERKSESAHLDKIVDAGELVEMQQSVEDVHLSESIGYHIVDLVTVTRSASRRAGRGQSSGGGLALMKAARARGAPVEPGTSSPPMTSRTWPRLPSRTALTLSTRDCGETRGGQGGRDFGARFGPDSTSRTRG